MTETPQGLLDRLDRWLKDRTLQRQQMFWYPLDEHEILLRDCRDALARVSHPQPKHDDEGAVMPSEMHVRSEQFNEPGLSRSSVYPAVAGDQHPATNTEHLIARLRRCEDNLRATCCDTDADTVQDARVELKTLAARVSVPTEPPTVCLFRQPVRPKPCPEMALDEIHWCGACLKQKYESRSPDDDGPNARQSQSLAAGTLLSPSGAIPNEAPLQCGDGSNPSDSLPSLAAVVAPPPQEKQLVETVFDKSGVVLWEEPYIFRRLHAAGESFIRDYREYRVLSSGINGKKISTVVEALPAVAPLQSHTEQK